MRFVYQAKLLSVLLVCSFTCGQRSTEPTIQSGSPPVQLKLKKGPLWTGTCLELSIQCRNLSKFSIFLDSMYEGIKIYSSVSDVTNALGQGRGEAWMLVYGWTDVVPEPIELAPGAKRQNSLCIAETFPVKQTGKETLRQVRVQGKLRIVAEYEIPKWNIIDQSLGKGRRAYVQMLDRSNPWGFGEVVLEIPIPCPKGITNSACFSPPPIFPGEHDLWTIEPEPPPAIELHLPPLPTFTVNNPPPPKP